MRETGAKVMGDGREGDAREGVGSEGDGRESERNGAIISECVMRHERKISRKQEGKVTC